ncbi:MAG TPA: DNA adenine methylase [Chthoniobacterales bacterium]
MKNVQAIIKPKWEYIVARFDKTLEQAESGDVIYCDPPYFGRYTDYFNTWSEEDEAELASMLHKTKAKFILSTWHHNDFRANTSIEKHWSDFHIITKEHFYHAGGKEENRNPVVEALVMNFEPPKVVPEEKRLELTQVELFAA